MLRYSIMHIQKNKSGFTLIELLVVISIIGLLASIAFSSLNDARDRAGVVRIAQDLQQIEKALILLADEERITAWWTEAQLSGSVGASSMAGADSYVPLSTLIADTNKFGKYLLGTPTPYKGTEYGYDSDGNQNQPDAGTDCFTNNFHNRVRTGVNIFIVGLDTATFDALDTLIDGTQPTAGRGCGQLLLTQGGGIYKLGYSRGDYDN